MLSCDNGKGYIIQIHVYAKAGVGNGGNLVGNGGESEYVTIHI